MINPLSSTFFRMIENLKAFVSRKTQNLQNQNLNKNTQHTLKPQTFQSPPQKPSRSNYFFSFYESVPSNPIINSSASTFPPSVSTNWDAKIYI